MEMALSKTHLCDDDDDAYFVYQHNKNRDDNGAYKNGVTMERGKLQP